MSLLVIIIYLLIIKKPSKEIYEFMSSSTAIFVELDQELNKLAQDGNLFKADFSLYEAP